MSFFQKALPAVVVFLMIHATETLASDTSFPLRQGFSPELQYKLELSLKALGLEAEISQNKLAVALVDMSDAEAPRVASVNGDTMMYAASLPKIAILLGAFERIYAGEMQLDASTYRQLEAMIRHSSNRAATAILEQVGASFVADVLQSPRYRLYDAAQNGGLWVGKPYGHSAAWQRDPLHNLSHGATALQTARYYYLLENGQLVSPEFSRIMKNLLARPAIDHKFVKGLKQIAPEAEIFRKSGTWKQWHADSAIVQYGDIRYIAVALMENPNGGAWLRKLIRTLDNLIADKDIVLDS